MGGTAGGAPGDGNVAGGGPRTPSGSGVPVGPVNGGPGNGAGVIPVVKVGTDTAGEPIGFEPGGGRETVVGAPPSG